MWPRVHAPAASDVFALVLSPMFLFIAQARITPVWTPDLHKEVLYATQDAPHLLRLDELLGWSVVEWNTANGILGVFLSALFLPRSSRGYASIVSLLLIAVNVYCHVVGKDYQHAAMGSVNALFVYGMLSLL